MLQPNEDFSHINRVSSSGGSIGGSGGGSSITGDHS